MKILAISHEYPPIGGGGANAAQHLLNGFVSKGHKVTLITSGWEARDDSGELIEMSYVSSHRADPSNCTFMEMLEFMLKAYRRADRLVADAISSGNPYDVCLIFFGIPSGPIGYKLRKKYGLPYLIRFGGGDIPGYQKRFTYVYKLIAPAIRRIWRDADARIANSSGLKNMAMDFCTAYEFDVIPNGVDAENYKPDDIHEENAPLNILFVSRLIERKGLQHIIPLLPEIKRDSKRDFVLTVVGDGPYRDYLEHLDHGDAEVIYKGEMRGDDVIREYRSADIFILPSSNEGMPNVVLEAMACGLPIVMTPCQGSSELIEGNGYVVPTDGFKDALVELINNDELRKKYAAVSRDRAVKQFSWQSTIDKYINIMNSMTESHRK